jgi:hypothetical protein
MTHTDLRISKLDLRHCTGIESLLRLFDGLNIFEQQLAEKNPTELVREPMGRIFRL